MSMLYGPFHGSHYIILLTDYRDSLRFLYCNHFLKKCPTEPLKSVLFVAFSFHSRGQSKKPFLKRMGLGLSPSRLVYLRLEQS